VLSVTSLEADLFSWDEAACSQAYTAESLVGVTQQTVAVAVHWVFAEYAKMVVRQNVSPTEDSFYFDNTTAALTHQRAKDDIS